MKKTLDRTFFSKYKNDIKREKVVIFSFFVAFSLFLTIISIPYDIIFYYGNLKTGYKSEKNIVAIKDYYAVDLATYERRREKVLKGTPVIVDVNTDAIDTELERLDDAFENLRKWSNSFSYNNYASNSERATEGNDIFTKSLSLKGQSYDAFLAFWSSNFSLTVKNELAEVIKVVLEKGYIETPLGRDKKIIKRLIPEYTETFTDHTSLINGKEELKVFLTAWIDKKGSDFFKKHARSITNFLLNYINSNCKINTQETAKRESEILSKIAPSYIVIKKGEVILRKGDVVQQSAMDKIEVIKNEELKKLKPSKLFIQFVIFLLLSSVFYIVASSSVKKFVNDIKSVLFIMTILSLTLVLVHIFYLFGLNISFDYNFYPYIMLYIFPYALTGMLLRLFLNTETAIIAVFFMTMLLGIFFPEHYYLLIYSFTSVFLGLHFISHFYTRNDLLKAGLKTGVFNLFVILLVVLFDKESENLVLAEKAFLLGGVFFSGFLSSIFLLILTPIFEYFFKYTTNITLFELSNLDNPLLKELMLKAPGTYNHSILIGSLAESAARAIKVNPLLARVSAYYHDIGKIKKPEFFIENQMGGYNKHEELTPYMSVLIVLSHVKDGIELAKEHGLGQPIIDAISQHHGTRLVTYFYAKALKLDPTVKEENFRYLGPKPKTREVGLIMMADAVEAACRVLEDPSPSRIKNLVKKIIQDIFLDGQLDECELTLKDLNLVIDSFTRTLLGIYHHRVDYPEIKTGRENGNSKKSL